MAKNVTNNLLLDYMKAIRAELAALTTRNRELRDRFTKVHTRAVALHRNRATDAEVAAALTVRIDRISDRVEIIRKRFELID